MLHWLKLLATPWLPIQGRLLRPQGLLPAAAAAAAAAAVSSSRSFCGTILPILYPPMTRSYQQRFHRAGRFLERPPLLGPPMTKGVWHAVCNKNTLILRSPNLQGLLLSLRGLLVVYKDSS